MAAAFTVAPDDVAAPTSTDHWTRYSATVFAICFLGWVFDVYETTIMQITTPILIEEMRMTPATMGVVTTVSRWIGLIGTFIFPVIADLYGRRPALIWSIATYAAFTGLTGFSTGWASLLVWSSITRIGLAGEKPVAMLMVVETAPTRWRATALGCLAGGFPFGYMLCSLAALVVVPIWGWRSLYFLGILPALLVLWVRTSIAESPRYQAVTARMLTTGLKKRFDIWSPVRRYPREMLIASLLYFFQLFTSLGWLAWIPFYLSTERNLGFQTMGRFLSAWMFVAIFAYWACGWLCDLFGRRWVIPAFAIPGAILLMVMGNLDNGPALFWVGLATNFLITGTSGAALGYTAELFPTEIRGTAVGASFTFGLGLASLAPMILGWIATASSVAAGLPLLALSFLMLAPLFAFFAPDLTRKELTDFVGQKVA